MKQQKSLTYMYQELIDFIENILADFSNKAPILSYFAKRETSTAAMNQDLLPLLAYTAVSNRTYRDALPLAAAWALQLHAAHLIDNAQDAGQVKFVHNSTRLMGAANIALARLQTNNLTFQDLLDAIGRIAVLSINAQRDEMTCGYSWSRTAYFRNILGKSAAIIAAGAWLGGRLATDDAQVLLGLKEFGLTLGMVIQLSDDLLDLPEDLVNGTYTLAVLDALEQTEHVYYPELRRVLSGDQMTQADADDVCDILANMGAITSCQRMIRAYQIQAEAAFKLFPKLEPHFKSYVAVQV